LLECCSCSPATMATPSSRRVFVPSSFAIPPAKRKRLEEPTQDLDVETGDVAVVFRTEPLSAVAKWRGHAPPRPHSAEASIPRRGPSRKQASAAPADPTMPYSMYIDDGRSPGHYLLSKEAKNGMLLCPSFNTSECSLEVFPEDNPQNSRTLDACRLGVHLCAVLHRTGRVCGMGNHGAYSCQQLKKAVKDEGRVDNPPEGARPDSWANLPTAKHPAGASFPRRCPALRQAQANPTAPKWGRHVPPAHISSEGSHGTCEGLPLPTARPRPRGSLSNTFCDFSSKDPGAGEKSEEKWERHVPRPPTVPPPARLARGGPGNPQGVVRPTNSREQTTPRPRGSLSSKFRDSSVQDQGACELSDEEN